jgi:hypothetical protein
MLRLQVCPGVEFTFLRAEIWHEAVQEQSNGQNGLN